MEDPSFQVEDPPNITYQTIKQIVHKAINAEWNHRWTTETDSCRQTREWFPTVIPRVSAQLLLERRVNLSKYILVLTGHNYWRRHNYIISYMEYVKGLIPAEQVGNPYCDLCHEPGEAPLVPPLAPLKGVPLQTSGHLVAECGYFNSIRQKIFGMPNAIPIEWIQKKDILRFFSEARFTILPLEWQHIEEKFGY